jgi:hypothetical protein
MTGYVATTGELKDVALKNAAYLSHSAFPFEVVADRRSPASS